MTDMTQADAGMLDATLSIHPGMLHGGPKPKVETAYSLAAGDDFNVTRWTLSAHAGTHVEAPLHTVDGAASVAALPLSIFVGPARVLDLTDVDDEVTAADLVRAGLADDERVLLKTTNSTSVLQQAEKAERWVGLAPDAAELLVARGVKLVGVDYLTVESPAREATFDAHYVLNGAGVAIIESVDLSSATAGPIELACLPMKLDAEAAPARVLLAEPRDRPTGTVIDISARVADGTLTWGKRPERIEVESLSAGDMCNVTRWYLGTHSGTHVDAPLHYNDSQPPIDEVALDTFIGPARVLDLTDVTQDVTAADLVGAGLADEPRVLLRTRNSIERLMEASELPAAWIGLAPDASQVLVDRGVRLIGIDFLTIEGADESAGGWGTHHVLCDAGVAILEGLDLATVDPGRYDLVAPPLPLRGAEAAPARAFLRQLS